MDQNGSKTSDSIVDDFMSHLLCIEREDGRKQLQAVDSLPRLREELVSSGFPKLVRNLIRYATLKGDYLDKESELSHLGEDLLSVADDIGIDVRNRHNFSFYDFDGHLDFDGDYMWDASKTAHILKKYFLKQVGDDKPVRSKIKMDESVNDALDNFESNRRKRMKMDSQKKKAEAEKESEAKKEAEAKDMLHIVDREAMCINVLSAIERASASGSLPTFDTVLRSASSPFSENGFVTDESFSQRLRSVYVEKVQSLLLT